MARNELLVQVREFIRQPVTFPSCYPKVLIMADGECLCAVCAKENYRQISDATRNGLHNDGWKASMVGIHWEGEALVCANCNNLIESAYGEPENE